ncbi:MAG: GntR family transcriptional regulator [Lentisphaeria bacterium]|nr:GntR family transcriptional regulator [Lentisphaeria bacterium]
MAKRDAVPVGLRIRHMVVDLLYHAPRQATMLPSASEMAKRFGISLSTVKRELRKLTQEGLIAGEQGRAVYTVPGVLNFDPEEPCRKIIGIIFGDGRMLCYGRTECRLIAYCSFAVTSGIGYVRHVTLHAGSAEDISLELRSMQLDGLIAIFPSENLAVALETLKNEGLPAVAVGSSYGRIPALLPDTVQAGRDMAAIMHRRGVRSALWMMCDSVCREQAEGVRQYFSEKHVPMDIREIANLGEFETVIREYAAAGAFPDAFYIHSDKLTVTRSICRKFGIPYPDWFMIGETSDVELVPDFRGIVRQPPGEVLGRQAAMCLQRMFRGEPVPEESRFQYEITER